MANSTAGQVAADAIRWAANGGRAPASIARLSTADQRALAQAGAQVKAAVTKKVTGK